VSRRVNVLATSCPTVPTVYVREAGVRFPHNEDATPEPSSERISRSYRVSSFRVAAERLSPYAELSRLRLAKPPPSKSGLLARTLRQWDGARLARTAGGPKRVAAANNDLARGTPSLSYA
jgi:hypothetical protein